MSASWSQKDAKKKTIPSFVEKAQAARLLERAEQSDQILGMATPYLFHHYVQALLECGQRDKAIRQIKRYWCGMVETGADIFWEFYNPEDPFESPYGSCMVNSYCHAWSCTPSFLLRKWHCPDADS